MEEIGCYFKNSISFQINHFITLGLLISTISLIPPSPFKSLALLHMAK